MDPASRSSLGNYILELKEINRICDEENAHAFERIPHLRDDFTGNPEAKDFLIEIFEDIIDSNKKTKEQVNTIIENNEAIIRIGKSCEKIEESHREIKESHRKIEESHREIEESHRKIEESHREIEKSHREIEESHKKISKNIDRLNEKINQVRQQQDESFKEVSEMIENWGCDKDFFKKEEEERKKLLKKIEESKKKLKILEEKERASHKKPISYGKLVGTITVISTGCLATISAVMLFRYFGWAFKKH